VTRFVLNDRGTAGEGPPSREPLALHRKLPGFGPTPVVVVRDLAENLGVAEVLVKDESSRLGLPSFKILGASWGVYMALRERFGELPQWSDVAELAAHLEPHLPLAFAAATDGNHGRAVARVARLLHVEARIFVPAGTARARIEAIESEGAACEVVDGNYDDAVARSAGEASDRCLVISDTSWPGYEKVPRWVIQGYSTIFWEFEEQLVRLGLGGPDLVVIQLGVGALGAAAAAHFRRAGPSTGPALMGVEPETAACVLASAEAGEIVSIPDFHSSIMAGLNCGTPSRVAWPLVSSGFDVFVAIDDDRARQAMRMLAAAGLTAGETGAAGLGGMLEVLSEGAPEDLKARLGLDASTRVLLLSTEGATDPEAYERIVGKSV
jgi:diaminopropionate ammonia-lyase